MCIHWECLIKIIGGISDAREVGVEIVQWYLMKLLENVKMALWG